MSTKSEVIILLRKILEAIVGPVADSEFAEVMDLATTDIKINRVAFGKRTCLRDVAEVALITFKVLQRARVA